MNVWHQQGCDSGQCVTASGELRGQKHYLDITPEPSQLAPSQINQKVYLFTRERNKFWITVSCVVKTVRDRAESSRSEHNSHNVQWDHLHKPRPAWDDQCQWSWGSQWAQGAKKWVLWELLWVRVRICVQESHAREEVQRGETAATDSRAARADWEPRLCPGSVLLCQIGDKMGLLEKCEGTSN